MVSLITGLALTAGCGEEGLTEVEERNQAFTEAQDTAPEKRPEKKNASERADCGRVDEGQAKRLSREAETTESALALKEVGSSGPATSIGRIPESFARSTIKVVILTALIDRVGGHEELSPEARDAAQQAIQDSDNYAARKLFDDLASRVGGASAASRELTDLLKASGDQTTTVPEQIPPGLPPSFISSYGATTWEVEDQIAFMDALASGDLLEKGSTDFVLQLMGEITPEGGSAWGLGTLEDSFEPRYKAGWGDNPGGEFLARQMGVISIPNEDIELTLSIVSLGGSQEEAYLRQSDLTGRVIDAVIDSCR